ncbi:rhamnan synthesis F family protein [Microbacterium trichothecenolyticum]|uniref:rhamnan synthesis F family protein n=1 Tax=Microbacterium trichothecenolyticum TaxID=69370 RepID=UPI0035BE81E3
MSHGPSQFPSQGRRLVVFSVRHSVNGDDPARAFALRSLRLHASRLLIAGPEAMTDSERAILRDLADAVVVVEDAESLDDPPHLLTEIDDLDDFDEIVFTDDSWFGPIFPFEALFALMNPRRIDGWVISPRQRMRPNWIAVRARGLAQLRSAYGSGAGAGRRRQRIDDLDVYLAESGLVIAVAGKVAGESGRESVSGSQPGFPLDGSPLVSAKSLSADPLLLDALGVSPQQVLAEMGRAGFPSSLVLQRLARTTAPRELHVDLGMLEVITDAKASRDRSRATLVAAHVAPGSDATELFRRLHLVPKPFDVLVTVTTADRERVEVMLAGDTRSWESAEVRTVPDDAHDVAALLVGCRDLLVDPRHDVVVRLRTGSAPGESANIRRNARRATWENLLDSESHARSVLDLFDRETGLGVVLPPTGYMLPNDVGKGWDGIREDVERLRRLLGIRVPLGAAPLAPADGMWAARAEALRVWADVTWSWDDYAASSRWKRLGEAQEALLLHAAGELGYHARTVATPRYAAVSHAAAQYMVDQLASTTDGAPLDRVRLLRRLGPVRGGGALDFFRMHLRANCGGLLTRCRLLARFARAARGGRVPQTKGQDDDGR